MISDNHGIKPNDEKLIICIINHNLDLFQVK